MKRKNIDYSLLWRKIFGRLNNQEEHEFERWLNEDSRNESYFKSLESFQKSARTVSEEQQKEAWEKLLPALTRAQPLFIKVSRNHSAIRYFYKAAAVFVVAVSAVLIWTTTYVTDKHQSEIQPGKPSATLITSGGNTIRLGDSTIQLYSKGIPASATQSSLTYFSNGTGAPLVQFNTLMVPRGGEFELTLADGTHVWLNSESSIEFPSYFTGDTRTVKLTGEAYFQVAKNVEKPFKVITERQTISVLGTSFNVSAYPQDGDILTTLEEGSIKVSGENGQSMIITPGNQSIYNINSGKMTSRAVETYTYTSWKNGVFVFDDEPLDVILQRIARWYDVDIKYNNADLQQTRFTVHIDKYQSVTEILKLIEITKAVDFEIEDRAIIVQ